MSYDEMNEQAEAIMAVARAIRDLGNADACTSMGAIEAFGVVVRDGLSDLARAVDGLAEQVRGVAEALESRHD